MRRTPRLALLVISALCAAGLGAWSVWAPAAARVAPDARTPNPAAQGRAVPRSTVDHDEVLSARRSAPGRPAHDRLAESARDRAEVDAEADERDARSERPPAPRGSFLVVLPPTRLGPAETAPAASQASPPAAACATDLHLVTLGPDRVLPARLGGFVGAEGEVWIPRATLVDPDTGAWPVAREVRLVGRSPREARAKGTRAGALTSVPLDPLQREVRFTPADAAALRVEVVPSSARELSIHVIASLLEPDDPAVALVLQATPALGALEWGSGQVSGAPIDVELAGPLQPGRWVVVVTSSLGGRQAPPRAIENRFIELPPGEAVLRVELPELHALSVVAPDLKRGTILSLSRVIDGGASGHGSGPAQRARLDQALRARFDALPAGEYELSTGDVRETVRVSVPRGEFVYRPRVADAYRLELTGWPGARRDADAPSAPTPSAPTQGVGELERAGFRTGDLLLSFDGRELRGDEDLAALLEVIEGGTARVLLSRAGAILRLDLGPMTDSEDPWALFDGDFVPAFR